MINYNINNVLNALLDIKLNRPPCLSCTLTNIILNPDRVHLTSVSTLFWSG